MTDITTVAVLGTGVLGSQIIMQNAYHGKTVVAYDITEEVLARLPDRWEWMRRRYSDDLQDFSDERFEEAIGRISTSSDLGDAVSDVDLVIEAGPESLELKRTIWSEVGEAASERAIFATNSSSLMPSDIAPSSGRPERFGTLHFANYIWVQNIGEVMGHDGTDPKVLDTIEEYAREIDIVPFRVLKETPGYLLNSMLIPWLHAGAKLYTDGAGRLQDIDAVWTKATRTRQGPIQAFDLVGFNVAHHIATNQAAAGDEDARRWAEVLKIGIDAGKTGIADGEGFYVYGPDGKPTGLSSRYPEVWKADQP